MDENDDLLKLEEFAPDALPESITAAPGAAYLIGTSYGTRRGRRDGGIRHLQPQQ